MTNSWSIQSANYEVNASPQPSLSAALKTFDAVLANFSALGINTVMLGSNVPINPVSGALETSFSNLTYSLESPAYLAALTDEAHAKGFQVIWNPGFVLDMAGSLLVNSFNSPNINATGFLNAVDQYWRTYAPVAQQHGVQLIVLGNEQNGFDTAQYTGNWLQIIADTRALYSGKLTYSAITGPDGTGHLTLDAIKFWGALDYVGAENWMPLQMNGAPMSLFSELGWPAMQTPTNVPLDLYNLSQQYGKPIYFEAFGSTSNSGSWTDTGSANSVVDLQAQYAFYKQFLDTFENFSWVVGATAWGGGADWMPDTSVPGWNSSVYWQAGYDFLGKPAGAELAQYWLNHGAAPPLPVISPNESSTNFILTVGTQTVGLSDHSGGTSAQTLLQNQPVQFTDQTISSSWFTQAASLSAAQFAPLIEIYIASFNRAPDAVGLDYWAAQLANGLSLQQIAASFFTSQEATIAYPAGQSTSDFVNAVYSNVLGRVPDPGGLAYWTGLLQSGAIAKNNFLLAIINGALAPTGGPTDAAYLTNKELVGGHFALTQGLTDTTQAKAAMAGVNATAGSVTTANHLTDGFAATASGHELVVQILGIVA